MKHTTITYTCDVCHTKLGSTKHRLLIPIGLETNHHNGDPCYDYEFLDVCGSCLSLHKEKENAYISIYDGPSQVDFSHNIAWLKTL